jgi:hypothetical protein
MFGNVEPLKKETKKFMQVKLNYNIVNRFSQDFSNCKQPLLCLWQERNYGEWPDRVFVFLRDGNRIPVLLG